MSGAVREHEPSCAPGRCRLAGAGRTELPRWTAGVAVEVGECVVALPGGLADALDLDVATIVLAAHAKVLASLTGRSDVVTGVTGDFTDGALPCRVLVAGGSWRALADRCRDAVTGAAEHARCAQDPEVDELFETVFGALPADPDGRVVLRVGVDGDRLWLRYRKDVLDDAYAARIAGYHLAALAALIVEPDAPHGEAVLLSRAEFDLQVSGMSGPVREIPDRRTHELFEDRVRAHPDAVAVRFEERTWTYAELNAEANRIAHELLARLDGPERVVAVVTERNLNWIASVLGIFKAGAAYLPIEPHFPVDRIAAMLSRSDCALVLAEQGSTDNLGTAVGTLFVDTPAFPDRPGANPDVAVGRDGLAYLYFTSGSTGEPKGAMCEQAGMLNHLYAKIDDLRIGTGTVVAQTAPQCFDISLWQLVAPLLAGGTTVIVPQDAVLDVNRFVGILLAERVEVAQVVPSYLDVMLSHLKDSRVELPDLCVVSATGEALRKELVVRWFERFPDIELMNAYGLTETSDDTNHEVLTAPPAGDRVPLGRPVNNVTVYVVDEHLAPVPLGATGEIVFSGVCVGRGYVNDPERTAAAFLDDPLRPGQRLYRSGDFGRWLPDGRLEFLGRRDAQVKVHGYRIEIGEIENRLLSAPGVGQGAVVVRGGGDEDARLVAFYTAPPRIRIDAIRAHLGEQLPEYMVPRQFVWIDTLPLSDNGKIDRKALGVIAATLDGTSLAADPPRTPVEIGLATAWAEVLGVPVGQIGRTDDFFGRGGTSLSALRLVAKLDGAVSIADLAVTPVLAELASLVGTTGPSTGYLRLLSDPARVTTGVLVCFPYAGGNAVNYRALAAALSDAPIAVHAVEPPGAVPTRNGGPFLETSELAAEVAAEIIALGDDPVVLWGHSAGSATAMATALLLQDEGRGPRHVFLGAQAPGDPAVRKEIISSFSAMGDDEIAEHLAEESGLDPVDALASSPAYRHDVLAASRYLFALSERPPATRLAAPVTVVIARDDVSADDDRRDHRQWALAAERVALRELPDGGHHFPWTRSGATAELIATLGGLT